MSNRSKSKGLLLGLGGGALAVIAVLGICAIIFFLVVVKPATELYLKITGIQDTFAKAQLAVVNRDLVELEQHFKTLESQLNDLRVARDEKYGWAKDFSATKEYYEDTERFINAGFYAIDAGREAAKLVVPFADAAGLKVSESTPSEGTPNATVKEPSLLEAFSTWISVMPQVANDSDLVLEKLAKVGKELEPVNTAKYPEEFRGVEIRANLERAKTGLVQLTTYAPDIKKALTIIPGLMGVETTEKRYMIIMQNDKEIRATGGFWTNYATFKLKNALLNSDFSSKDMYSIDLTLDAIDAYFTFPKAPASYQKYLKVERLYARDTNISPDFPTSIDQFMYFYKLAMKVNPVEIKPVNGIIAIDTEVVRELMEVTGPVTVNGVTYTADNVVLELEKIASLELREQSNRKKVLGDLMQRMLINVFESDKNLWSKLIEKGIDLALRKHITAYLFDAEGQVLLEKYKLAGRIIDPVEGDYSFAVSTNLGGDKTNWFVKKEVDHTLTQENGKWLHTVKVKYSYPQPANEFGAFVKRFRDWLRVYAPKGSEIVAVEGTEDGTVTGEERNKTYFTGYIELGPNETKEMTFKYYLPTDLVKSTDYRLYIQKQSGTNGDSYSITTPGNDTKKIELNNDFVYTATLK